MPPTPTALPAGSSLFAMSDSYSLWGGVPTGVQIWHMAGTPATVIQVIFLIALVIVGISIVIHFIGMFIRKDAES